ncbi:MAG: hypothetical protein ACXW2U_00080 [Telluria sp.]
MIAVNGAQSKDELRYSQSNHASAIARWFRRKVKAHEVTSNGGFIMEHTLIAVFDNRADAQSAMDELLLSGFSQQSVRLSEEMGEIGEAAAADTTEDEGFAASIKHFFNDVFGRDTGVHSHKYSTAVSKGHHVLTVTASGEQEVERAADIVERFGPVDIDEKTAEWGGAAMPHPEAMRMSGAGGIQQWQGSSLQFHEDRHLFAQGSLNDERPMGTTYQETMGPGETLSVPRFGSMQGGGSSAGSMQRDTGMSGSGNANIGIEGVGGAPAMPDDPLLSAGTREMQRGGVRIFSSAGAGSSDMNDDTYYRSHWDSTYSAGGKPYDEYAPAYSFGHEMANMYRGQPWNDVESDVRNKWESRHTGAGASTWEQFKDAVRHGWNRLTS